MLNMPSIPKTNPTAIIDGSIIFKPDLKSYIFASNIYNNPKIGASKPKHIFLHFLICDEISFWKFITRALLISSPS